MHPWPSGHNSALPSRHFCALPSFPGGALQGLFGLAKRLFDVDIEPAGERPAAVVQLGLACRPAILVMVAACPECACPNATGLLHASQAAPCHRRRPTAAARLPCRAPPFPTPSPCPCPADGTVPVWQEDVRFFVVKKGGAPKAYFYLDPYSRPAEKRGGAW